MSEPSTSAVAHLNAQTAAANFMGQSSHLSTLWSHVTQRFPELRNATHYYAYDVAKASKQVVEAAVSTVSTALHNSTPTAPTATNATNADAAPLKDHDVEWETHYIPAPSSTSKGLVVQNVELQNVPGPEGGLFLVVILEKVGYAIFEVSEQGVFEVFTDLSSQGNDAIAVQMINHTRGALVLRAGAVLERVSVLSGAIESRVAVPNCVSPTSLSLIGASRIAIMNRDFYQITLLDVEDLSEKAVLYADANLVTASSHALFAYCALPEESPSQTKYSARPAESTLQSVARNVSSFSKLLWGTTPQSASQVQPLGAVALYDVLTNEVVGSFCPHNHVIAAMSFNGDGTILATASHVGTFINIFQILRDMPRGSTTITTSVTLLARLYRGVTRADIVSISFSPLNLFVAAGTAVGTCHIFSLENIQQTRGSAPSKDSTAEQIFAIARVRSAPCGSPVNPRLAFSSMTSDDASATMLVIVSAFGVVTAVRCSKRGISNQFNCYLDRFKGPRERLAVIDTNHSVDVRALHCNAQVELETHERYSPLENFCFQGDSGTNSPDANIEPGEWDECVEVRVQLTPSDRDSDDDFASED